MLFSPLVIFHICAGSIGLLSGAAAMVFRKGSRRHSLSGKVFALSMLSMSATGAYMGFVQHLASMQSQMMNIFNGVLTFYLVATGWATSRRGPGKTGIFDWGAFLVVAAVAAGLMTYGIKAATNHSGLADGYPAGMYFFFGSVALLSAAGDLRMLLRGGVFGAPRVARHLWRMSFALLIAATSFFLGQQKVFPASVQGSALFYAPPLLVLVSMIFWLIRVQFSNAYKKQSREQLRKVSNQNASSLIQPQPSGSMTSTARSVGFVVLSTVIAVTVSAQSAHSDSSLQQKLESLRRSAMTAWQTRDVPALNGIMSPDFVFVGPGGPIPREQWLGGLLHCSLGSYTMDQVQFHQLSADSAVLIYKLHYVGQCDGNPNSSDSIVEDTAVRREQRWWIVNTSFMPQQK